MENSQIPHDSNCNVKQTQNKWDLPNCYTCMKQLQCMLNQSYFVKL